MEILYSLLDIKKSGRRGNQPIFLFIVLSNAELFWFKYLGISLNCEYSVGNTEKDGENAVQRRKQLMRESERRTFNEYELLSINLRSIFRLGSD